MSYQTTWRWWKSGALDGYQLRSGTIIINVGSVNQSPSVEQVASVYARVLSAENRDNLDRQAERLVQYAIAKGYRIHKVVKEVAGARCCPPVPGGQVSHAVD